MRATRNRLGTVMALAVLACSPHTNGLGGRPIPEVGDTDGKVDDPAEDTGDASGSDGLPADDDGASEDSTGSTSWNDGGTTADEAGESDSSGAAEDSGQPLLPDGAPCEAPDQCESGYCWSGWNFEDMLPEARLCRGSCIEAVDPNAYCWEDSDCCNGSCIIGGAFDGFCAQQ